jgi:hypothetical protein
MKVMNPLTLIISFFCFSVLTNAQQPVIEWQQSFGGTAADGMETANGGRDHVRPTIDGGYIVATSSNSDDGDVTGHNGSTGTSDFWVFKVDSSGSLEWGNSYGGSQNEMVRCINPTTDGGYILTGYTNSPDGDVTGWHGANPASIDVWVVKLDSLGNLEWEQAYGGSEDERGESIVQTADGGYVFTGFTTGSTDGDVSGAKGGFDVWLVKINSSGTILWQKCLGGSDDDQASSVRNTTDGGLIITGRTTSGDGDAIGNPDPTFLGSIWVIKTDDAGNIQWQKSYGGSGWDSQGDIRQTSDGGYLVGGSTSSNDGDASGNHGSEDFWVFKIDNTGTLLWQHCYGGSNYEQFQSLSLTSDNGFLATGMSTSIDGDLTSTNTSMEYWVIKGDSLGNLIWQRNLGGSASDLGKSVIETADGGTLVVGESLSNDGDVSGHHGSTATGDVWMVKLSPTTTGIQNSPEMISVLTLSPNPVYHSAQLTFELSNADDAQIKLYDISGRLVKNIADHRMHAGVNVIKIQLYDEVIEKGLYLLRVSSGSFDKTIKLIKR